MLFEASDNRKQQTSAISSGLNVLFPLVLLFNFSPLVTKFVIFVSVTPGAIAFTLIPSNIYACANHLVNDANAVLLIP